MVLRASAYTLAVALQEAMSANDIRDGLQNAISAAHDGDPAHAGHYHGYVDHTGDENSGDVTFTCDPDGDGDTDYVRAPYSKGTNSSDDDFSIDTSKGKQVAMRTAWEEVPDDADGYAAMQEAKLYTPGGIPLCERFVSKKERAAMPKGRFAGKGTSFPINNERDVTDAADSIGRAGPGNYSTDVIKKNIIRIAKENGWESALPKAWQDDSGDDKSKESATINDANQGRIVQLREGAVNADGTALMKIITPGWGSSGYYSAEMLARDLPKIYPAGTKNFWNHQTPAEEAARPEGDLRDLASVLAEAAYYDAHGPDGPGGYAKVDVVEQYRDPINQLAKHIGASIRADGTAKEGMAPDGKKGRIIEKLTRGISVDYVTTPGAGGRILQLFEAARANNFAATLRLQESAATAATGEGDMDQAAVQRLVEAANAPLLERAVRGDARELAASILRPQALRESGKVMVMENIIGVEGAYRPLPMKDGALDAAKFTEAINTEAKRIGTLLSEAEGAGRVRGLGTATLLQEADDPAKIQAREAAEQRTRKERINIYADLMGGSVRMAEAALGYKGAA